MDDVTTSLAAEVRRLRKEASQLEERLRAIERSRWYRLNPRRAWRRMRPPTELRSNHSASHVPPDGRAPSADRPVDIARFETEIVARGQFTQSWAVANVERWEQVFAALDGRTSRILEIGCFEGLWSCLVLWRLPEARVTCVDTFRGGLDHSGTTTISPELERVFDANVALVGKSRVRKLVGDSRRVLVDLMAESAEFDLIYVDGSHLGLDVAVDAALSWQLLESGGYLVFDDYEWAELGGDPVLRPGPAIDSFLALVEGKYETIFAADQIAVRRTR